MEEPDCCKGCRWYQETTYESDRVGLLECQHPSITEEMCLNENRPKLQGIHYESLIHQRATFLFIERRLEPQPPKNSSPHWYGAGDKLCFYLIDKNGDYILDGKGGYKKTEDIDVPEAGNAWMKRNRSDKNCDDFESYGHCEVFYDELFGWQLRWKITHERADLWRKKIIEHIEEYHNEYHKRKKNETTTGVLLPQKQNSIK